MLATDETLEMFLRNLRVERSLPFSLRAESPWQPRVRRDFVLRGDFSVGFGRSNRVEVCARLGKKLDIEVVRDLSFFAVLKVYLLAWLKSWFTW